MKHPWMLSLVLLGAAVSSGCASTQVRNVLVPIPVDPALRPQCVAPTLPADPVTPSALSQFSLAQGAHAACEQSRADALLGAIDAHNAVAQ